MKKKKRNKSSTYSIISPNFPFFIYHHLVIEKKRKRNKETYLSNVCSKTLRYMA